MAIVENKLRVGRFTSSQVYLLIGSGRSKDSVFSVAGMTYIKQKYHERKLKRSMDLGRYGQSAAWGQFLEQYVYSHFTPLEYSILSQSTKVHPTIDCLAGSVDVLSEGVKVGDIKCYEPKNFCDIVDCFETKDVEQFKKDFPKEYWQLVSNAMIHGVKRAESIVYMPFEDDLEEIRESAMNYDGSDQWKYRFIYESEKYLLPYVPKDSGYKDINKFEFEIPQVDIDLLTDRLYLAEQEIQKLINKGEVK